MLVKDLGDFTPSIRFAFELATQTSLPDPGEGGELMPGIYTALCDMRDLRAALAVANPYPTGGEVAQAWLEHRLREVGRHNALFAAEQAA